MVGDSSLDEEIKKKKRLMLFVMLLSMGLLLGGLSWSLQTNGSPPTIAERVTPTLNSTPSEEMTEIASDLKITASPESQAGIEATATARVVVTAEEDHPQITPNAEAGSRPAGSPEQADEFKTGSPTATKLPGQITAEFSPTPTSPASLPTGSGDDQEKTTASPTAGTIAPTKQTGEAMKISPTPEGPTDTEDRQTPPGRGPTGPAEAAFSETEPPAGKNTPSPEPPAPSATITATPEATPGPDDGDGTVTAQESDEQAVDSADGEEVENGPGDEIPERAEETGEPSDGPEKTEFLVGKIEDETSAQATPARSVPESSSGQTDQTEPPVSGSLQEETSDAPAPRDLPVTGLTSVRETTPWWMVGMAVGVVSILLIMGVAAASGRKIE